MGFDNVSNFEWDSTNKTGNFIGIYNTMYIYIHTYRNRLNINDNISEWDLTNNTVVNPIIHHLKITINGWYKF